MPTLLHGPRRNLGEWYGMPPSCALLGRFAIGAWVALLWQKQMRTQNVSEYIPVLAQICLVIYMP